MIYKTALLIFLHIICVGPTRAAAEVKTNIVYKYYDVALDESDSLAKSVFSVTPIFHDGSKFAGLTNWKIQYKYTYSRPSIGICQVKTLEVTCDCTITLPRLTGGDAETSRNFKLYLLRLDEHERRHCDIAIEHANQIEFSLKEVKAKCGDLASELKARYDRIYEETISAQARYDHQTQHGKYEGADISKYDGLREQRPQPGAGGGGQGLKNAPDSVDSGFYQDADGVWRNY